MTISKAEAERRARGPVLDGVNVKISELSDPDPALVAIARALASKVDQAAASRTGAIALATSSLSKELRSVLVQLQAASDGNASSDLLATLLSED